MKDSSNLELRVIEKRLNCDREMSNNQKKLKDFVMRQIIKLLLLTNFEGSILNKYSDLRHCQQKFSLTFPWSRGG